MPAGIFSGLLAVQRRDLQLVAERRLREADVEVEQDVVAVALEQRVLLHGQDDVEVAASAAVEAHLAFAADADLRALFDSRRNPHLELALPHLAPAASTLMARLVDDPALAAAAVAGGDVDELAEDASLGATNLAAAVADGALARLGARLGAQAVADGARLAAVDLDLLLGAEDGLFEGERQAVVEVAAALRLSTPARAAEEGVEDVAEAADVEAFEGAREGALGAGVPEAVVHGALLRVGEHLVGLVDLLEALLGARLRGSCPGGASSPGGGRRVLSRPGWRYVARRGRS